jgi:hypothetical protein
MKGRKSSLDPYRTEQEISSRVALQHLVGSGLVFSIPNISTLQILKTLNLSKQNLLGAWKARSVKSLWFREIN